MNILFTCAGRRNYLLHYFKDAVKPDGMVIAADMQSTAPAMAVADKAFVVPSLYDAGYIDKLLDICGREQVTALVSLNDLDLPILARAREKFENIGTTLLVSSEDIIDICFDKWRTFAFARDNAILCPKTCLSLDETIENLNSARLRFPLTVKPRWGSASIGIEFPENMAELKLAYELVTLKVSRSILAEVSNRDKNHAVLIQEKLTGTEYGIDILNDLSGRPAQVYVKEKLAMRAGETDKALLRRHTDLEKLGFEIGKALGHIGNLDVDCFESHGKLYLLEMNPRFGGGYPFSHEAGADYPAAIVSWLKGAHFDFSQFKRKYDQPYAKCDTLIKVGTDR